MTSIDKANPVPLEEEKENRSVGYKIGNFLFIWGAMTVLISIVTSGVPSESMPHFSIFWNIGFGVLGTVMCFSGMWLLDILSSIAWFE